VCLSRLANVMWFLGCDDETRQMRDDAVAMASGVRHPYSRGAAFGFAALVSIDLGDVDAAHSLVAALAHDEHPRPTALFADALAGCVDVLRTGRPDGTTRIRSAIDQCDPVDTAPGVHACLLRLLVAAHQGAHRAGDAPAAGLAATEEALGSGCSRLWEPENRLVRARLLQASGAPPAQVSSEVATADAVARRQGAAGPARRAQQMARSLPRA
jgi:hypothetical protein